jgi:hypothetical protein
MEQNAPAVEILLAESTYREVGDLVEARTGPVARKGSDLQIPSHRLVSVRSRDELDDVAPPSRPGMRACQVCGEEVAARYRYCVVCGATAEAVAARDSRKTVTIVFANPAADDGLRPARPAGFTEVMTRYFEAMKAASNATAGRSRSSSAMRSWPSSACRCGTRTMHFGPRRRGHAGVAARPQPGLRDQYGVERSTTSG